MRSNQPVTGSDESTAAALDERKHQDSSIRRHEGEVVRTGLAGLVDGFWARVDNLRIGQRLVMMVALVILPLGGVLIDSQRSLILAIGAMLPGIVLAVILLARIARQTQRAESLATAVAQTRSSAIASIAAAVEQLFDATDEMRINARVALRATDTSARTTREIADTSRDAAQHLTAAARVVADAGGRIAELATQSEEISRGVRVIKEIADQTTLLALNAAIAATHAGERGRDFAAVADEIRKLAERTGNSTQEIAAMIQRIQNESRSVANEVAASSKEVGAGAKSVAQAGEMVASVESALDLASQAVQSISDSLTESSAATRDIAGNMGVAK